MGFAGGLLGTAGGAAGTGFATPQQAPIQKPTTDQQAKDAYTANQAALAQQQAFLNQLQGQNGIQNQSNVFNQLQGVANGTGPNPAQAMLANNTGANVANQAALMAGQRGAGANAGLIARQAAQQGANTQQQAAGQGAALQAQQSLNALNQLGGIAGQQVGQQQTATQNLTASQQAEQQQLLNSIAQQNNAAVGMQSNVNTANAGLANTTMQGQQALLGGLMNAAGAMFAEGGTVPAEPQHLVDYSKETPDFGNKGANELYKGSSSFGKHIAEYMNKPGASGVGTSVGSAGTPGMVGVPTMAEGGQVPALVSPGEIRIKAKDVPAVAKGEKSPLDGEKIPGKPKVSGSKNSYANDTVPKTLNEGDIILPRSVTQSKHPHWAAHKFVSALMAKKGNKL